MHGEMDQKVNEINNRGKKLVHGFVQCPQVLQPEVVKLHISVFCLYKWHSLKYACLEIINTASQQLNYILRDDHIVPMQDSKNRTPAVKGEVHHIND